MSGDRGAAVKPAPFTYHRATTAKEAVEMLAAAGDEGTLLAGGQSFGRGH